MHLELMEKKLLRRQRKMWQLHNKNKDVREDSASISLMNFPARYFSLCFNPASKFLVFFIVELHLCVKKRGLYDSNQSG